MIFPTSGTQRVTFQQERAQDCFAEVKPLLEAHWQEVAPWPDLPLDPDWDLYRTVEDAGWLLAYTVRMGADLAGYAVYFVRPDVHSKGGVSATQDLLFLVPDLRVRFGARFIAWCDEQLRKAGVQIVYQGVTPRHDFGPLLERLGYERFRTVWIRRLAEQGDETHVYGG